MPRPISARVRALMLVTEWADLIGLPEPFHLEVRADATRIHVLPDDMAPWLDRLDTPDVAIRPREVGSCAVTWTGSLFDEPVELTAIFPARKAVA